jgi:hypothetical protein
LLRCLKRSLGAGGVHALRTKSQEVGGWGRGVLTAFILITFLKIGMRGVRSHTYLIPSFRGVQSHTYLIPSFPSFKLFLISMVQTSHPVMRDKISQARIRCLRVNLDAPVKGPRPVKRFSFETIRVAESKLSFIKQFKYIFHFDISHLVIELLF